MFWYPDTTVGSSHQSRERDRSTDALPSPDLLLAAVQHEIPWRVMECLARRPEGRKRCPDNVHAMEVKHCTKTFFPSCRQASGDRLFRDRKVSPNLAPARTPAVAGGWSNGHIP